MALNARQSKQLSRRLDRRHRELLAEVRDDLEQSASRQYVELIGQLPGDVADQSVADMLADLNVSIVDRHIEALRQVEAAAARIRAETYGTCVDCGEEIGFARLTAYPVATRCIRCQQRSERIYAHASMPTL
jgi:RNA polymerase-binding protein DksA